MEKIIEKFISSIIKEERSVLSSAPGGSEMQQDNHINMASPTWLLAVFEK